MKHSILCFLILMLISPSMVWSEPFWCPPGRDSISGHPLKYETMKPRLTASASEVDKLQLVKTALQEHLNLISTDTKNTNSILAFQKMMNEVLDVNHPAFLYTSRFRFNNIFKLGIYEENCESTPEQLRESRPALLSIYMAAETVKLIGTQASLDDRNIGQQISKNYSQYNSWLLTEGLPQWPWELWLNGKLVSSDIRELPPLYQAILLRPSVGLDLSYPSQEEADLVPSLGVELVGFIKYQDRSYKKHYGASLFTTINTEDGAGFGLSIRWNGFMAGYTSHSGNMADTLFVGFDLYSLLKDDKKRKDLLSEFAGDISPLFVDITELRD